jgi:hypothetical protein
LAATEPITDTTAATATRRADGGSLAKGAPI